MKTALDFEKDDTKKLLAKLDFEFFLKQNIEIEKYSTTDIDSIYSSFKTANGEIKRKAKGNRKQFNYYAEGQVRKMFTGGLLPALFELDESRSHSIIDFPVVGNSWAYFNYWRKYQRRKITKEKIWDIVVKSGSVLAILLSILKFLEYTNILKQCN